MGRTKQIDMNNLTGEELSTNQFTWNRLDDGDYLCRVRGYILRIEKLDKALWWYAVQRIVDQQAIIAFDIDYSFATSLLRAVGITEGLVLSQEPNLQ